MILCSCKAVSDRTVERLLDDGAVTIRDLGERCGAGTDCGSCVRDLRALIEAHHERRTARVPLSELLRAACSR